MHIQLVNTKAKTISLTEDEEINENDFSLSFSNCFNEAEPQSFLVMFEISITSEQGYSLEVSYVAEFTTDEPITSEFKISHFPIVNAPAIAYPYMRGYVSTVTLNSGYEPLILPTINFQAMAEKTNQDNSD